MGAFLIKPRGMNDKINFYKYLFISIEKCIFAPNKSLFETFGCPSKAFERRNVRGLRTILLIETIPLMVFRNQNSRI